MEWQIVEYEVDGFETVFLRLSDGQQEVQILADVELSDRRAVLRGVHILGAGPRWESARFGA